MLRAGYDGHPICSSLVHHLYDERHDHQHPHTAIITPTLPPPPLSPTHPALIHDPIALIHDIGNAINMFSISKKIIRKSDNDNKKKLKKRVIVVT